MRQGELAERQGRADQRQERASFLPGKPQRAGFRGTAHDRIDADNGGHRHSILRGPGHPP